MNVSAMLQRQVVHESKDFVVVHKPAGVPVSPTVDNILENVLYCTAQVDTIGAVSIPVRECRPSSAYCFACCKWALQDCTSLVALHPSLEDTR